MDAAPSSTGFERGRPLLMGLACALLVVAPFVAMFNVAWTVVGTVSIGPMGDTTPLFVVGAALLARRWKQVASPLLGVTAALASIVVLEWVAVYARWGFPPHPQMPQEQNLLGSLLVLFMLQVMFLVGMFTAASFHSLLKALLRIEEARRGLEVDYLASGPGESCVGSRSFMNG